MPLAAPCIYMAQCTLAPAALYLDGMD